MPVAPKKIQLVFVTKKSGSASFNLHIDLFSSIGFDILLTGGYLYLDTSYKQVNKIFSTAALESGEPESLYIGQMDRPNEPQSSTTVGQLGSLGSATTSGLPVFKSALLDARPSRSPTGWTRNSSSTRQYERQFIQEVLNASVNNNGSHSNRTNFHSNHFSNRFAGQPTQSSAGVGDNGRIGGAGGGGGMNENRTSAALIREQPLPFPVASFDNGSALLIAGRDHQSTFGGQMASSVVPNSGVILSPNISATGPMGNCLRFYYNMDGLSAERLKILVFDYVTGANQTLWETSRQTEGEWIKVEVSYAYDSHHKVRKQRRLDLS